MRLSEVGAGSVRAVEGPVIKDRVCGNCFYFKADSPDVDFLGREGRGHCGLERGFTVGEYGEGLRGCKDWRVILGG